MRPNPNRVGANLVKECLCYELYKCPELYWKFMFTSPTPHKEGSGVVNLQKVCFSQELNKMFRSAQKTCSNIDMSYIRTCTSVKIYAHTCMIYAYHISTFIE